MKSKTVLGPLAVVFAFALSPALAPAQNAGFGIGVAPPQFVFPSPQAPAVAMRGTFAAVPSLALPAPQAPITTVPLVPSFPTVIVPHPRLTPVEQIFPGVRAPIVNPGAVVLVPPNPRQPGLPFRPQAGFVSPLIGTPRAEVLRRLGQPTVTFMSSTGETLYFTGGVTVILQNGLVIGPR